MSNTQPEKVINALKDLPLITQILLVCFGFGLGVVAMFVLPPDNGVPEPPAVIPTPSTINYQILVSDTITGNPINNALVTIYTEDGPLYGRSDNNGFAPFFISSSLQGQPGLLVTTANGYESNTLSISLQPSSSPHPVQLQVSSP
jgi:hypothetical protein